MSKNVKKSLQDLSVLVANYVSEEDAASILAPFADELTVADQCKAMRDESRDMLELAKNIDESRVKPAQEAAEKARKAYLHMVNSVNATKAEIKAQYNNLQSIRDARAAYSQLPERLKELESRIDAAIADKLNEKRGDDVFALIGLKDAWDKAQQELAGARLEAKQYGDKGRELFEEQKAMMIEAGLWVNKSNRKEVVNA